jgi:DNA replication and repair protein RecF
MAHEIHKQLTDGQEELVIEYRSSIPLKDSINLESIQNSYRDALERAAANEIFRGISLIGPHRDDLIFKINGSDARVFASQGQQRTAVLSVKLAEMQLLSEVIGESPVVLLDDVMSELDDRRRAQIFQYLADDCQVFITCTNLEALSSEMADKAEILTVQEGRIECALKKA